MAVSRPVARAVAVALSASALALGACGDDGNSPPTVAGAPTTTSSATTAAESEHGADERGSGTGGASSGPADGSADSSAGKPSGPAESGVRDPRQTARERAAARTVRELVAALDARDGARVCALLAPGAIEAVDLPRERGGCAASLTASIGYRDPRGLPVWQRAEVSAIRSVQVHGERARVIATTATRFSDRDEISVEDDVVYLVRDRGRWLVAKPSSTVYRAVGIADVPPSVLAPPAG